MPSTGKKFGQSSIKNQSTNGGDKKAGLPGLIGRSAWTSVALNGTKQNMTDLKIPVVSTTKASRPTGSLVWR